MLFLNQTINDVIAKINSTNKDDIAIDTDDIHTIFGENEEFLINTAEYQGKDAAFNAINDILKSVNINSSAIVHFRMSPAYPFMELSSAMNILGTIPTDYQLIYGTTTDESLPMDFIHITLITASINKFPIKMNNNVY